MSVLFLVMFMFNTHLLRWSPFLPILLPIQIQVVTFSRLFAEVYYYPDCTPLFPSQHSFCIND